MKEEKIMRKNLNKITNKMMSFNQNSILQKLEVNNNRRLEQNNINQYFNNYRLVINKGYINQNKNLENTRLICININGFSLKQLVKIDQFIKFCNEN